ARARLRRADRSRTARAQSRLREAGRRTTDRMTDRQSWVRHAEQIADLVLDLAIRAVNRTRDLGAQELAIATAQAVRRDAYGAGAQAERLGRMPVRLVVLVADQMRLEE